MKQVGKTDLTKENLDFLWRSIQVMRPVQRTQILVASLSEAQCKRLFRHHREAILLSEEIKQRADMDLTLGAYGLLTVGAIAGYIELPTSASEMIGTIRETIGKPSVRDYHEAAYPTLLPNLLLDTLDGKTELPVEDNDASWASFQWLIRFAGRFNDDMHLTSFLRILDSGRFGGFGMRELLGLLQGPTVALAALNKPDTELSGPESVILGMFRFLHFCRDLHDAFRKMDQAPIIRSAIWFGYANWFIGFGQNVAEHIKQIISLMADWLSEQNSPAWAFSEAEDTKREITGAIEGLTSGAYSTALLDGITAINPEWPGTTLGTYFQTYRPDQVRDKVSAFWRGVEAAELDELHATSGHAEPPRRAPSHRNKVLNLRVEDIELSVRSHDALKRAGIQTVGELVRMTEAEILKTGMYGRKSLNEIKDLLASLGLRFGMKFDSQGRPITPAGKRSTWLAYQKSYREFSACVRRLQALAGDSHPNRAAIEAALVELEKARIIYDACRDRLAKQLLPPSVSESPPTKDSPPALAERQKSIAEILWESAGRPGELADEEDTEELADEEDTELGWGTK